MIILKHKYYCFHPSLQPILTRLRAIFDLVIMFQHKQSSMLTECLMEVERRAAAKDKINKQTKEVCHGIVQLLVCVCMPMLPIHSQL